ncbi:AAA family ATPase [Novosphingobium sp. BL-52-GroH]|uniref:bifunctional aminoglycoside phosphotransferase/ATP-binding protein n=1 Tax=Novosphingobium sp. BL-52-GroH TaxID=3349877 RepID=UPI00384E2A02
MGSASPSTEHTVGGDVASWIGRGGPWGGTLVPERIDTHAASVFLAGDRAWKLKRPVKLPYLDFSSVDLRHGALEAELRLNRRTAPKLYLALHKVTLSPSGALRLDGDGDAVDWLLEMQRFPEGALLADQVEHGTLADAAVMQLADHLAHFHEEAESSRNSGGAARLRKVAKGNAARLAAYPELFDSRQVGALTTEIAAMIERNAALLDLRSLSGRVRRGHGDLHLGNIAMIDGSATPFDCLEFDEELATADVLYDLAFLLMDLWHRGARRAANMLFNRYLDVSADEGGAGLLPLFMSVRATVRAHVMAATFQRSGSTKAASAARDFLILAQALLGGATPVVVAIAGLSGTGKTTLAREIGADVGGAPGARILRSDVLRKRLAGLAPETSLPPSCYNQRETGRVYAELTRLTGHWVGAGSGVVADAVFGQAAEKRAIELVAQQQQVPFHGFWLDLAEEARLARIRDRGPDASDATVAVAQRQSADLRLGPNGWSVLPAGTDIASLAATIRETVSRA